MVGPADGLRVVAGEHSELETASLTERHVDATARDAAQAAAIATLNSPAVRFAASHAPATVPMSFVPPWRFCSRARQATMTPGQPTLPRKSRPAAGTYLVAGQGSVRGAMRASWE